MATWNELLNEEDKKLRLPSTHVTINFNKSEFILYFHHQPQEGAAVATIGRYSLDPNLTKQLLRFLSESVKKFESEHGVIQVENAHLRIAGFRPGKQ